SSVRTGTPARSSRCRAAACTCAPRRAPDAASTSSCASPGGISTPRSSTPTPSRAASAITSPAGSACAGSDGPAERLTRATRGGPLLPVERTSTLAALVAASLLAAPALGAAEPGAGGDAGQPAAAPPGPDGWFDARSSYGDFSVRVPARFIDSHRTGAQV